MYWPYFLKVSLPSNDRKYYILAFVLGGILIETLVLIYQVK